MRIIQISDPHVGARRAPAGQDGDDGSMLDAALAQAAALRADAVLLSGDLLDRTAEVGYDSLGARLEGFRQRTGIPILPLMGNHDRLPPFLAGLAPLLAGAERRDAGSADHVRLVGGLQVVALDSTVSGQAYGALSTGQLDWLHEVARRETPLGTCVTLHHPPVQSPMAQLRYVMLANADALAEALAGVDVRIVLCGHYHHTSASVWAGHLVWCAPALAYSQDLTVPPDTVRGWPDHHLTVVDIDRTAAICTTATVNRKGDQPTLVNQIDPADQRRRWDGRDHTDCSMTPRSERTERP